MNTVLRALTAIVFAALPVFADDAPDARTLLKEARAAQEGMNFKFTGSLRVGPSSKKTPFILTISKGSIRYEFQDTGDAITLTLGEKGSRLEETTGGTTKRVTAAKFDAPVRGTSITYEDLSMQFLYWKEGAVADGATVLVTPTWAVELTPPAGTATQYTKVRAHFSKTDRSLMKLEAFGAGEEPVRTFTARSAMQRAEGFFLKKMEITGTGGMRTNTFLELDDLVR